MTQILLLLSSPRGPDSQSTKVARALAERLASGPGAGLVTRDLAADALPHVGPDYLSGRLLPPERRTAAQAEAVARAEILVGEVSAADVVVIAASMINFAPSSTLKAWIDHVVWPGRTLMPGPQGLRGTFTGKKAWIVAASGAVYSQGSLAGFDMLVPYLRQVLGFLGIADVETIRAEGQTLGPERAAQGVAAALDMVAAVGARD